MAYNYSNPYAAPSQPQGFAPPRSTFSATQAAGNQRFQVLFSGLPPDVSEKDLREILFAPPLSLPASATQLTCFYNADKVFLGMALIGVTNEVDAERIRLEYSGQLIDNTYRLTVQHVLAPTSVLPSRTVPPFNAGNNGSTTQASSSRAGAQQPKSKPPVAPKGPAPKAPSKQPAEGKAPGLQLLARINKSGKPTTDQLALLARQKANMKKGPGNDLLARLAKQKPTTPVAKAKAAKAATGAAKVGRAKAKVNKDAMDVDQAGPGAGGAGKAKKDRPKPKTQEELDAEMAMYERQRRFGAAAQ